MARVTKGRTFPSLHSKGNEISRNVLQPWIVTCSVVQRDHREPTKQFPVYKAEGHHTEKISFVLPRKATDGQARALTYPHIDGQLIKNGSRS